MSLAEKWEEYRAKVGEAIGLSAYEEDLAQRAYYAGAEVALDNWGDMTEIDSKRAEIDRFKGLKNEHSAI